ncbi:hypothetical protein FQA39_LY01794 [Lamprigera yunnana]|nr:hypothetical protein FQA39_LY01794 [Lamprigera yunnana]
MSKSKNCRVMVVVVSEPIDDESEPMIVAAGGSSKSLYDSKTDECVERVRRNIEGAMTIAPLVIKSPVTGLELMYTGIRLQNMPLVKQCIQNLDALLNPSNVILIYSYLSKCKVPSKNENHFEPSAPPFIESDHPHGTDWVQDLTDSLRHNCLLEIDKYADLILKQKEILDLSYLDILGITERDSLQVTDEMLVYSAVYRWAIAECRRLTVDVHPLYTKAVLRQLIFTPRYGLIAKSKFLCRCVDNVKGPSRSGLLEEKEWRLIKFYIQEISKKRPVAELPHKWSQPRIIGTEKPKILSSRSSSSLAGATTTFGTTTNCHAKTTCEKCLINFLSCWTAIFD